MEQKPRILCVDDSKTQLLLYKQDLKELVFDVEMETNPTQALEKIKKEVDLTLVPVMIISSLYNRNSISQIFSNGACDFLKKPFFKEEFLMRIRLQIEHLFLNKYYLEHRK